MLLCFSFALLLTRNLLSFFSLFLWMKRVFCSAFKISLYYWVWATYLSFVLDFFMFLVLGFVELFDHYFFQISFLPLPVLGIPIPDIWGCFKLSHRSWSSVLFLRSFFSIWSWISFKIMSSSLLIFHRVNSVVRPI